MAVELVTGYAGTAHVSSSEDGARQAGTVGTGMYALETVDEPLKATLENANAVTVGPGDVLINGRHVRLTGSTTYAVPVGTQGMQTSNLLVLRYEVAEDGTEGVTAVTLTGEPAASDPSDPALATGSILDGDSPVDMPLYRVVTTGIESAEPVQLFETVPSIAGLPGVGDNVLDVAHGGTGMTSDPSMLVNLASSGSDTVFKASPRPGVTGTLPVSKGGTGATSASAARTALGVPPTSHASSATTYGAGNASKYGHVKLTDSTSATDAASSGVAASPKMVRNSISQAVKQTTLGSKNGITCTYRVWQNRVVECAVEGRPTSNFDGTLTIGTLPAAYRPKQQANIVCNVSDVQTKTFFQTLPNGAVNVLAADGLVYAGASVYCARTWLV